MKLIIDHHPFQYETENLCKTFFPAEKLEILHDQPLSGEGIFTSLRERDGKVELTARVRLGEREIEKTETSETTDNEAERRLAVMLCRMLEELTGFVPPWGILTGIRPVKFVREWHAEGLDDAQIKARLTEKYLVSDQKADLLIRTGRHEQEIIALSRDNSYSLYVAIPFCPTRCRYCSFVSHAIDRAKKLVPQYLELLCRELEVTAKIARELSLHLETVYIGGGTPTTLTAPQLKTLLDCIEKNFDVAHAREFTVEAGRPDTIDREKLEVIRHSAVTRISINPQTLNDDVLREIGRNHTAGQFVESFHLAREVGIGNINADLIAGLPTDTEESFEKTLRGILALSPENITLHTLSVKRAADLRDEGAKIHAASAGTASHMVDYAYQMLTQNGYEPYYLYRQKNMLESLENVGYARAGYEGLYNVYIMDETHTILAAGAGAVTKLKNPHTDKLERIFNFKFPYEYISRYEEILSRKERIYEFYREL